MIPFNVFGHSNISGGVDEPIVWVDSSDAGSYTLSGNDVTALLNKGSLGGAMTLNVVKFANGGFEGWDNFSLIKIDLGEPFLTNNSFTMATTFDFQNISQALSRGWWGNLYADTDNRIGHFRLNADMYNQSISSSNTNVNQTAYNLGVQTLITSYDVNTNTIQLMNFDGTNDIFTSIVFDNIVNAFVWLLRAGITTNTYSGQNNPLHEFRLYNRAFDLTEMQNLQTELNNKYTP